MKCSGRMYFKGESRNEYDMLLWMRRSENRITNMWEKRGSEVNPMFTVRAQKTWEEGVLVDGLHGLELL
jgi:hypothetical protein